MEVSVGVFRHVIVEDNVDTLNVHSTTKQVGGHQDSLLEVFELLVPRQPKQRQGTWKLDDDNYARVIFSFVHLIRLLNLKTPKLKEKQMT